VTAVVVQFFVPGIPIPQGSKKAYVRGKRAQIVDDNADVLKPWRALVTRVAVSAYGGQPPLQGALVLSVVFGVIKPRSVRREFPSVKPDLDKYVRAIGDAITDAKVWVDDGQVVTLSASKRYSTRPGATVRIGFQQSEGQDA
jgi:Holliday junction resolvase RusA-like endonuclease